jgi:biopolymer transport protein ExbD/biopolymer transport protein TolR
VASFGTRQKTIGEINITPLTDVFLVLLVVVIITAPALSRARGGITSPEVNQAVALKSTWLVANVEKDGTIYVDGAQVAPENLHGVLSARAVSLPEKVIVVRGDRQAQSGMILNVLRTAKEVGFVDGFIAGQITRLETGVETP